jgi:hypothetical protein
MNLVRRDILSFGNGGEVSMATVKNLGPFKGLEENQ